MRSDLRKRLIENVFIPLKRYELMNITKEMLKIRKERRNEVVHKHGYPLAG